MALVLLVLGLIGAGIYTESTGFYWAAGAVGAVWVLFMLLAGLGVRAVKRKMDREFDNFGSFRNFPRM